MRLSVRAGIYAVLLALGIPWYWPAEHAHLSAGFPAWVWVAIAAGFAAAVFTAWCLKQQDE